MSKFYVGQRVRLARAANPKNSGLTGTIREFPSDAYLGVFRSKVNCLCDWDDGTRDGFILDGFDGTGVHTDQLEPLTDPGREVVSWEACEWKPEHLRAIPA